MSYTSEDCLDGCRETPKPQVVEGNRVRESAVVIGHEPALYCISSNDVSRRKYVVLLVNLHYSLTVSDRMPDSNKYYVAHIW